MEPDRLAQLSNDMMEALDQKRLAETLDRMREREVAVELNAGALETAGGSLDRFLPPLHRARNDDRLWNGRAFVERNCPDS